MPQQPEINAVAIQQMLFAPRQQLGGQQPGQQVNGHAGLDHGIQLMVDIDQRLNGLSFRIQRRLQFLILFVKHIRQRPHQGVLAVKIVIERAFGGAGLKNDVLHRGFLIPLLIKELPRCGNDPALGVAAVFLCHWRTSLCHL